MTFKTNFKSAIIIDVDSNYDDIPENVVADIRSLWKINRLGNDFYYFPINYTLEEWDYCDIEGKKDFLHQNLLNWISENFDWKNNTVLIHFWW